MKLQFLNVKYQVKSTFNSRYWTTILKCKYSRKQYLKGNWFQIWIQTNAKMYKAVRAKGKAEFWMYNWSTLIQTGNAGDVMVGGDSLHWWQIPSCCTEGGLYYIDCYRCCHQPFLGAAGIPSASAVGACKIPAGQTLCCFTLISGLVQIRNSNP